MWLDYAEDQARRRKQVFLKDWDARPDAFLRFNEREVLADRGGISKAAADSRAEAESLPKPKGAKSGRGRKGA